MRAPSSSAASPSSDHPSGAATAAQNPRRAGRGWRLSWVAPLLLLTSWCSSPARVGELPAVVLAQFRDPEPASAGPLLRALLDTTAAGSAAAADARLGLEVGAAVRRFYGAEVLPAWTLAADSLNAPAREALALLHRAREFGLRPADYGGSRLRALRDSLTRPTASGRRARQQARLELLLTDAVLRFMLDLGRGRLRTYTVAGREKARGQVWQPAEELRAALSGNTVAATLRAAQPTHCEYRQLQQALARWLTRPVAPDSAVFRQVQYEHAALNLERWRWETLPPDSAYILINIPAYELQVVAHDSVVRRHCVIVGKPETPTPTLSSRVSYFTLAPEWRVPRSIAVKEMLLRLREDAGYLARNGLSLYDARGLPLDPYSVDWRQVTARGFGYSIRQAAGCDNALGNIVFRFANPYSVYLHDTPMRQFFTRPDRALSHGCVRLEQPLRLAAYLLRREGRREPLPNEAECARQPQPRDVRLHRALPLHIRYATCVAENGHLRFLPDIYHLDEPLRKALFGPTALPAKPRPAPTAAAGREIW
ncbi:L,D-transpeptidase scaffold domain-containing protein [Hymenobacter chitinivorans]|uniref:L,D-transpeptidase-like protein n=1 Tax=Hymenobacter chitinivorans DSM 11115 TaxID=1121954 RepID=A0A2M9BPM6_9BACT|nr:L,D-transpeptidase family protein [Hymenobacter chitinivorans]PJJ59890.1 L,D-transpeptidase-like protein [Hymenobacter chitinivorans DSM 11115]